VSDPDRTEALRGALRFHLDLGDIQLHLGVDAGTSAGQGQTAVLTTAETFLAWLRGPATMSLHPGQVIDQITHIPTGTPVVGELMQIHDNEQFDLTVDTRDAKGFETQDAVAWASSDPAVASLAVSADTRVVTVVAGVPGSAVITVTDGTLSATEAVDVVPAGTATIALVEGPVTTQP
jgi:hypothetical protein